MPTNLKLWKEISKLADSAGIDFIGVADLSPALPFIREMGGDVVDGFPLAVSIGIRLPDPVVDMLPKRFDRAVAVNYRNHAYVTINYRLDVFTSRLAGIIQREGFRALPIPAAERSSGDYALSNDKKIHAVFSHKLAAHLAGFGWIGKSCLLVTPQYGPRVRWSSVLTDAPLKVTGKPIKKKCGKCRECVDICPVKAFKGREFDPKESREMRYDAKRCQDYHHKMETKIGLPVCGMCLYVCPSGRKKTISKTYIQVSK